MEIREKELSEIKLIKLTLLDLQDHIMPMILRASMIYIEDKIAIDQLNHLSREFTKITNIISTIYLYRELNGDRSQAEKMLNSNSNFACLKSDWLAIWNRLVGLTSPEIADLLIKAINKLTELREDVYNKCNCYL